MGPTSRRWKTAWCTSTSSSGGSWGSTPEAMSARRVPVILNGAAGTGSNPAVPDLEARFAARGLVAQVHVAAVGSELPRIALELVREAPPLIVAAGGDGTVS